MNRRSVKLVMPCLAAVSLVAGIAIAFPPPGWNCYVPTWFKVTQSCTPNCGGVYDTCPARVLCDNAPTGNKETSPIVTSPYPCTSFSGGTGACGACVGGTPVTPPATVIIPNQACTLTCP